MSLRINQNITSLNAHRWLSTADTQMGKSIERLSSGFRINSAADDAAGLALSENLRTQVSGLDVASQNTQYGINMIKTTEKALDEVESQLRNIRDLTLHASNANGNAQSIAADDAQVQKALSSIDRIANQTEFAGKKLLSGTSSSASIQNAAFQVGANAGQTAQFSVTGTYDSATLTTDMHFSSLLGDVAKSASVTADGAMSIDTTTNKTNFSAATQSLYITGALDSNSAQTKTVAVSLANNTSVSAVVDAVNNLLKDQANNGTNAIDVKAVMTKADGTISMNDSDNTNLTFVTWDWSAASLTSTTDFTGAYATGTNYSISVSNGGVAAAQTDTGVGALKSGVGQSATVATTFSLTASSNFTAQLTQVDNALKKVTGLRVSLGAFQKNTLESNLASVAVNKENLSASESDIRDTDMAAEMVSFTRAQILMQAASSMMTQANQAPQSILQMLR